MRILLASLLLTGCAAFAPEPYNIKYNPVPMKFIINPMLPVAGRATYGATPCVIELREYPICLAHEVRHCIEGEWHPPMSASFPGNSDDCWQDGQQQNLR